MNVDRLIRLPESAAGSECRAAVPEARALLNAIDGIAATPLKAAA